MIENNDGWVKTNLINESTNLADESPLAVLKRKVECAQEAISSSHDSPSVILKRSRKWSILHALIPVVITLYGIFAVILPVLLAGDYAAVGYKSIDRDIYAFYFFCIIIITMPFWVPVFKVGTYYFYDDRLEVGFWARQKIVIPYKQMHVSQCGGIFLTITAEALPGLAHPFKRYKILYWNGLSMMITQPRIAGIKMWENPADVPKVVQILRERAFKFVAD